jgi:hypothetical protein
MAKRSLKVPAIAATATIGALILASLYSCNRGRVCVKPTLDLRTEPYGATDINAIAGNQGLSVGINKQGTITLFKWPNPSFYDHVKFMTTSRDKERLGALENEGIFTGVYYETDRGPGFFWLRDLKGGQYYLGPRSVVVETSFTEKDLGLRIFQLDLVEPDRDVMWRSYLVGKLPGSEVKKARLVAYINFAPKVSKLESLPLADWCLDEYGGSSIRWSEEDEAFVQHRRGRDLSTGKTGSVALAFGFDRGTHGRHAGFDGTCSMKRHKKDPYKIARQGVPAGSDSAEGKVSAAVSAELVFDDLGEAVASLMIAAAGDEESALDMIAASRDKGVSRALYETEKHWKELLDDAPLPDTDNQRIKEVALRSVITLLLGFCKDSGAIVASSSTQPPYGFDWPRDGAYMNEALLAAGFHDLVKEHNMFYARTQSQPDHKIPRVPMGNWASNYYADGVPGMPYIWWEIDETSYGIWTLFRYYEETGDRSYLEEVYPAIKRAADFLTGFRDPKTGKPKPCFETDIPKKNQSIRGSQCAYFGLKFAVLAAKAMGDDGSANKWGARRDELERVVHERFYDKKCSRFVLFEEQKGNCEGFGAGWENPLMLWPVGLLDFSGPLAKEAAQNSWESLKPSFTGGRDKGSYEPFGLLSLAKIWKHDPEKIELIRQALDWQVSVPITATGHFGEIWNTRDGEVYVGEAQPQLWHHALYYLAALEAFGIEQ